MSTETVIAPDITRYDPFKVGQRVYIDKTPMTGKIMHIDRDKHGRANRYHIQMKGKWPRVLKRTAKDISTVSDYDRTLYPGRWNLNPGRNLGKGNWEPYRNIRQMVFNIEQVFKTGDIKKLHHTTYHFIIGHMGLIAHYDLPGFRDYYGNQLNQLAYDLVNGMGLGTTNFWWADKFRSDPWYTNQYGRPYVESVAEGIRKIAEVARDYLIQQKKNPRRHNPDDENTIVTSHKRYCDFCDQEGRKELAFYDGATKMGPWANMCVRHFQQYGIGLGTGRGQKYQYQSEDVASAPPAAEPPKKGQKIYVIRGGRVRTLKDELTPELIEKYFKDHPDAYRCTKPPTEETMMRWEESGIARATDGCKVEPDGDCHHGRPSWLKFMGLMNPRRRKIGRNPEGGTLEGQGGSLYDFMLKNRKLYMQYSTLFYKIFGVQLSRFWNNMFGFDVIKFDEEFIKPPEGVSTAQEVERKYGEVGLRLIKSLI
jgi:hypothetical protein